MFFFTLFFALSISDIDYLADDSASKTICIADDESKCAISVQFEFIPASSVSQSTFYTSGTLNVHLYSSLADVNLEIQKIKGDLNFYGHLTNSNYGITLKSSFLIRPSHQISLHNVKAALADSVI